MGYQNVMADLILVQPNRPVPSLDFAIRKAIQSKGLKVTFSSLYLATIHSVVQNHIILMRRRCERWVKAINTESLKQSATRRRTISGRRGVPAHVPDLVEFHLRHIYIVVYTSHVHSPDLQLPSPTRTGPMAVDQIASENAVSCVFDSDDADIILLSKNPPTEFHVHKVILAAASPFFHDMFTLPQPPSHDSNYAKPVIPVTESCEAMTTLLRFVYPLPDPHLSSLDEFAPILDAAIKYDFQNVISTLRRFLCSSENLRTSPIQVYAIACRFDLEEEAQIASSHTLSFNIIDGPLYEDLKYISAWHYHRLLGLHHTRSKNARQIIDPTNCPPEIKCMQCNSSFYSSHGQPKWYYEWEKQAKEELAVRPVSDAIFSMDFIGKATKASGCARCSESVFQSWTWLEQMKQRMDALPTTI